MATLRDLKPSITQMGDTERFSLIKETRFLRRQIPPKKAKAKAQSSSRKKPLSPKATVARLTKEQKLQLLKELGG